jgi:eukaryotic-like serine/threonine-protein kinase
LEKPSISPAIKHLETVTKTFGIALNLIPAGEFLIGSPDSDQQGRAEEKPSHRVRITRPFYLGKFEVTQAQYQGVMGKNPSMDQADPGKPVGQVSWLDAVEFCNKMSEREGFKPFYDIRRETAQVPDWNGTGYRLPTDAEWEYACRAGTTTRYSFGDDNASLGEFSWFNSNSGSGDTIPNYCRVFRGHHT